MTDLSDREVNAFDEVPHARDGVIIVAIAGTDVAAFERLTTELPRGCNMAFVLACGGEPGSRGLNVERLQPCTNLRVESARDGQRIEADHIYVTRSDQLVACGERALSVQPRGSGALTLDNLFRSLARHHAERSAAVLLSGIRSDGSIGAAEMKAAGALVVLQTPINAVEASLPEQQLLSKSADVVVPVGRIVSAVLHYFEPHRGEANGATALAFDPETLLPILAALGETVGHDFTRYKRSTVTRRIQRRMRVHGLTDPELYVQLLRTLPAEAHLLFNEMLIGVTSFFRDPGTYEAVERALDAHLQRLPMQQDIRVWVPACSTGEEAYSLAILLHECVQRAGRNQAIKIFATDVDSRAIDFARAGRYPLGVSAYVSQARLDRYFVQEDDTYRINKETRERIIFAPHNVTRDPPFTHIDMVSCRNLLIYLEPELQQQVLALFEYALEPGGLLLLGGSESVGALASTFDMIDKKAKLFVHRAPHPRRAFSLSMGPLWGERTPRREDRFVARVNVRQNTSSAAEQMLMSEFVPPSAVISANGELVYLYGRTGRFLEPAVGEPSTNVFDMAREGLRLELPAAVRTAHHSQQQVLRRGLNVRTNGSVEPVTLMVKPLEEPECLRGLLLVTFTIEAKASDAAPPTPSQQTSNLEAELHYVRSTLQGMIEDLESSNEELKSMNEELQSTNEEVQSSNEELSTSREELQSLNEELQTLNEELAQRNSMLSQSNDDMHNLLTSVHVATVFVDAQLNIKRFTAPAKKVFRLRDSDIGRPVSDLVVNLDYRSLIEDAQEVLRTLVFAEREVQTTEGEWRLMRILPYRTASNVIDGLIITVTDIQRLKEAQRDQSETRTLFEDILASHPLPLVIVDGDFNVVAAGMEFIRRFHVTEPELTGKALSELAPGWRHPAVKDTLGCLERGEPCPAFRVRGHAGTAFSLDLVVHPRRLRAVHPAARYLFVFQDALAPAPAALTD